MFFYFDDISLMTWNYRVVKKNGEFGVHGVYYNDDDKIVSIDLEPNTYTGSDLEDLRNTIELMLSALDKEVIDFETLEIVR